MLKKVGKVQAAKISRREDGIELPLDEQTKRKVNKLL